MGKHHHEKIGESLRNLVKDKSSKLYSGKITQFVHPERTLECINRVLNVVNNMVGTALETLKQSVDVSPTPMMGKITTNDATQNKPGAKPQECSTSPGDPMVSSSTTKKEEITETLPGEIDAPEKRTTNASDHIDAGVTKREKMKQEEEERLRKVQAEEDARLRKAEEDHAAHVANQNLMVLRVQCAWRCRQGRLALHLRREAQNEARKEIEQEENSARLKQERENSLQRQTDELISRNKLLPLVESMESRLSSSVKELENKGQIKFTNVSNESTIVMFVDIISVSSIRATNPDTYVTLQYCGYEILRTNVYHDSHSPSYHNRLEIKFDDKISFEDAREGDFAFKLFQRDLDDGVAAEEEIDEFLLEKGQFAEYCLSIGGADSTTVSHSMKRGCSMKVRYGSYGGGILPKLYDKINTDLATKVRGPLCVPKSSKAEEDTDEEIKSQCTLIQETIDAWDHSEIVAMYQNVHELIIKMDNILEFETEIFGGPKDRDEKESIVHDLTLCRSEHLHNAARADDAASLFQTCQVRVTAYVANIRGLKKEDMNRELEEVMQIQHLPTLYTKRMLLPENTAEILDLPAIREKFKDATKKHETAIELINLYQGVKNKRQQDIVDAVAASSLANTMVAPMLFQELEKHIFRDWNQVRATTTTKYKEKKEEADVEIPKLEERLSQHEAEIHDSQTAFAGMTETEQKRVAEAHRNTRMIQLLSLLGDLKAELSKRDDIAAAFAQEEKQLTILENATRSERDINKRYDHSMKSLDELKSDEAGMNAEMTQLLAEIERFDPESV